MDAAGVTPQSTSANLCAEPNCPNTIPAREPGKIYFLHCDAHRTTYTGVRDDFPATPALWGRRTCTACVAVFERYTSQLRGSTERVFCGAACRNQAGARPRGIQERACDWCGKTYKPRNKGRNSRFCSFEHMNAWKAAQPKTRKRPTENNEADLNEVRLCAEPECETALPPRDPSNGYRRKWCDEHRYRSRTGGAMKADPNKKITLTCFNPECGKTFERYKVNVRFNTTNRYFCSAECRKKIGSKPRTQPWFTCEWDGTVFQGRAGAMNRFCSKGCQNEWQRRDQTERICRREDCGTSFWMAPSHPDVYCSNECWLLDRQTPIGKREVTPDGYVRVYNPEHREAQPATGWVMEHRMVVSDLLGRKLYPGEEIHHLWGDRSDNRPEALELWDHSQPAGQRVADRYKFYKEWIARMDRERPILEAAGVTFHSVDDEGDPAA